jgi:glucose-6-phosphate 1-dehydrogenase
VNENEMGEGWLQVPFILKAGKGLNEHKTEIRVQLNDVPGDLFNRPSSNVGVQTVFDPLTPS